MSVHVRCLPVCEVAFPVKAILNNLGEHLPHDVSIEGVTEVAWSDGTTSEGVKGPGCVYYIETNQQKIVVDTGVGDFDLVRSIRQRRGDRFYLQQRSEWDLSLQLRGLGTDPADIATVISTHLHWDHVGGNRLFRNARFYVQAADLQLARTAPRYAPHFFKELARCTLDVSDRLVVLEGNACIAPGIEVWKVGGHTPGSQVVAIESDRGLIVLAGDVISRYENWDYEWPGPMGNMWSLRELVNAIALLKARSAVVIPSHDWKVWQRFPGGIIV